MSKILIVVAPTGNAVVGYLPLVNTFAEAMMKEERIVYVQAPIDLPVDNPDLHVYLQTHDVNAVAEASAKMMEQGVKDTDVTAFSRQMYNHNRLVTSLMVLVTETNIHTIDTAVGDLEPILAKVAEVETVFPAEVKESIEVTIPQALETIHTALEDEPTMATVVTPPEESDATTSEEESETLKSLLEAETIASPETPVIISDYVLPVEEQPLPITHNPESVEIEVQPRVAHIQEPPTLIDDFDPIAAAFETSVAQAQVDQAETETTLNVETLAEDNTLEKIEYPNYPKVDMTVELPAKLFSESKNERAPSLADFAGAQATYTQVFDGIERKIEFALENKRRPKLDEFEQHILAVANDSVANEELHKQQYVDNARWSAFVSTPTTKVPVITPIKNPQYGDSKYVGPDSVSLLQNRMKIGCKLGVFLPHTGIYAIINSPSDEDVLNTLSIINNYRIEALRSSSGILLGNSNFYLYRQVLNLFINNISGCSLANWNKEQILNLIDERDMNIIAASVQASIYPDGYEYRQACGLVKGKTVCKHITSKMVDLRRMVFVDNSRLSENQRNLAAGGLRERSINEIRNYQEANYLGYKKAYEITEGISFVYRSQPIHKVIEAGEEWIKEIEAVVDSIVTFNEDEETRNTMIAQRINLTRIREYSHWVSEIQIDSEMNVVSDRNKINQLLNSLSRNGEVMERVSETLAEFQRLAQVAIVAIPRVACEVCQQTDPKDLDISPHLIPQDAVSRFFTLARQRLS